MQEKNPVCEDGRSHAPFRAVRTPYLLFTGIPIASRARHCRSSHLAGWNYLMRLEYLKILGLHRTRYQVQRP
jgi:hypothetical protein